jgi:hypothetical protein
MVERKPEHRYLPEVPLRDAEGTQILLSMFDRMQETAGQSNRECFNQLVRFWADCLRMHPMLEEDHRAADLLIPRAETFLRACMERKGDYFGEVFAERNCGDPELGEIITAEEVVRCANDLIVGSIPADLDQWQTAIDPAAGTGRFLVDLAARYPDHKIALFGVEKSLDLHRACLVNMRLYAWNRPYFILCADSLIVDVGPNSPAWRWANLWNPPHWADLVCVPGEGRGEVPGTSSQEGAWLR